MPTAELARQVSVVGQELQARVTVARLRNDLRSATYYAARDATRASTPVGLIVGLATAAAGIVVGIGSRQWLALIPAGVGIVVFLCVFGVFGVRNLRGWNSDWNASAANDWLGHSGKIASVYVTIRHPHDWENTDRPLRCTVVWPDHQSQQWQFPPSLGGSAVAVLGWDGRLPIVPGNYIVKWEEQARRWHTIKRHTLVIL